MAKRLAYRGGQGSQKYLPQMQKDVDKARAVHKGLGAEPLFDQHVVPLLDFAIQENIVTPSEVEKPREKGNRRLALLLLYHHVIDLPWHVAKQINKDMKDYLEFHELDVEPDRDWAGYARIIRGAKCSLPIAALARIAEKALYEDTTDPSFYGVAGTHPGIRMTEDWDAERKIMTEPDLVVWRKLANIFGYRRSYNQIGESALENSDIPYLVDLLEEARKEKARLAPAFKRTRGALSKFISNVCNRLTEEGIRFKIETRTKGDASIALKLDKYREIYGSQHINSFVHSMNDLEAAKIVILREEGAKTENIRGDRLAQRYLLEEAEKMRLSGEFPYENVRIKDYSQKPKPNGYRSDQVDFLFGDCPDPEYVSAEVQIQTEEMERFNQFGGAAHIAYKDGKEYEDEAGVLELRDTILSNVFNLLDEIAEMAGEEKGSRYQPFPREVSSPVRSTIAVKVKKNGASSETFEVAYKEGDHALDILARSGLDIRSHTVNGGKSFSSPVNENEAVEIVERPGAVSPGLARTLYNSKTQYRKFTQNKLAEIFMNGNGKGKKSLSKKKAKKKARRR